MEITAELIKNEDFEGGRLSEARYQILIDGQPLHSCMAVPFIWFDESSGILAISYTPDYRRVADTSGADLEAMMKDPITE